VQYARLRACLSLAACLAALAGATGCTAERTPAAARPLRVGSSYSLDDSGLMSVLAARFRESSGLELRASFVGTDKALALGRGGLVDAVVVHSRADEDVFVRDGFGVNRRAVMYSEYVIVGPAADPAGIRALPSAVEALRKIALNQSTFCSRGDQSGNHTRERSLWALVGSEPRSPWYVSTKAGMFETLRRASEARAYALADRPTYLAKRKSLELEILVEGDSRLHNQYAVIAVNPLKVGNVDYEGALRFVDFLTSPAVQKLIGDFGRQTLGQAIFSPNAGSE